MEAEASQARLDALAAAIRASSHNLVSRSAREELTTRHIPECLEFARMLPASSPVLDVGSGGGLPGLVIAVARPELQLHLLEATGKKVHFLRETAQHLGLDVEVHHGRAEDLAVGPLRKRFPVITARAVAPLSRLVPWCMPYLAEGGALYAIKGERWRDEVEDASEVFLRQGVAVAADPESDPDLGPTPAFPRRPRVVMLARVQPGPDTTESPPRSPESTEDP